MDFVNLSAHSSNDGKQQREQQHQTVIQYSRSPFEFPSTEYESFQENGTKYLKNLKCIPVDLQEKLNACAGEIFLSGIPPEIRAEAVAEIAAMLGEIYVLRYKVNFSGDSRGFAYLQYLNPSLMHMAITRLPQLFRQHALPMIRVRQSRNSCKLLLKKTYRMSPQNVYETLCQIITFDKLIGRELFPGYFEYQIVFKCNEEAVHARREILRIIAKFGRNAIVVWDISSTSSNDGDARGVGMPTRTSSEYPNHQEFGVKKAAYTRNGYDATKTKSVNVCVNSNEVCRRSMETMLMQRSADIGFVTNENEMKN